MTGCDTCGFVSAFPCAPFCVHSFARLAAGAGVAARPAGLKEGRALRESAATNLVASTALPEASFGSVCCTSFSRTPVHRSRRSTAASLVRRERRRCVAGHRTGPAAQISSCTRRLRSALGSLGRATPPRFAHCPDCGDPPPPNRRAARSRDIHGMIHASHACSACFDLPEREKARDAKQGNANQPTYVQSKR